MKPLKTRLTNLNIYLENLPLRRLVMLLLLVGVSFSLLGVMGGTLFLDARATKGENKAINRVEERLVGSSPTNTSQKDSLVGLIQKSGDSLDQKSYVLLSPSGETLATLVADDDKLSLAEGSNVEVSGEYLPSQGSVKLMRVFEITFR